MSFIWDFGGKTALVTGGASGIGKAIVRKFGAAGATIVFSDMNEAGGRALEQELRGQGAKAHFFVSDAADEAQVKALVESAFTFDKKLDIAVNNVGGIGKGDHISLRVHETDFAAWRATQDMNLTSCFLGMKYQIPRMLEAGGGAIVNFTSLAGMNGRTSSPAYAAAKAAVIRLTEHAAATYGADGIRVNVIAPGLTGTEAIMKAFPDEEMRRQRAAISPMQRIIDPQETADACLWACSQAASGVTGLTIPVDGGKLLV
jgi:NAD(P)-dependent dehydrogenase (short-subunit alcohol dehydrogenase family)